MGPKKVAETADQANPFLLDPQAAVGALSKTQITNKGRQTACTRKRLPPLNILLSPCIT